MGNFFGLYASSLTPTAKEATSGSESSGPDCGVAETWELLVSHEFPETCPVYVSKDKLDGLCVSVPEGNRQLGVKTSRILERLEVPRKRTKATSPNTLSIDLVDSNALMKPLTVTGTQTQLMKPNFNKLKRKRP